MIKLKAPDTYTAEIDGTVWHGITPESRFWDDVQAMIAGGAEVADTVAPQPPTPEQQQAAIAAAIDAHVEATARERGYNGAAHLASYVTSTVGAWQAEATTFVAWRDAVWLTAYAMLADALAEGEAPQAEDALAALPMIEWPE